MKLSEYDCLELVWEQGKLVYSGDENYEQYSFTEFLEDLDEAPEEKEMFVKIVRAAFEKGKVFNGTDGTTH